jgi:hypothetical protein
MQDRYAGDLGDFSKFALTKMLHQELGGKVGIIWFRFPDESHNNDGRHTKYVSDAKWIACDPVLVGQLQGVVRSKQRSICALENALCLPQTPRIFEKPSIPAAILHGQEKIGSVEPSIQCENAKLLWQIRTMALQAQITRRTGKKEAST